ncbi:MAG TPA: hypothetical protein VKW78_04825 [Terriglobales bacterium]|nr:hypothetical protein [Terriglobales bacterium]
MKLLSTPPIRKQGNRSQRNLTQSSASEDAPPKPSIAENLWMTLKLLMIGGGVGLLIWLLDTIRVR